MRGDPKDQSLMGETPQKGGFLKLAKSLILLAYFRHTALLTRQRRSGSVPSAYRG